MAKRYGAQRRPEEQPETAGPSNGRRGGLSDKSCNKMRWLAGDSFLSGDWHCDHIHQCIGEAAIRPARNQGRAVIAPLHERP